MRHCDEFIAVTATGDVVSRCLCGRCDWVLAALKRMAARRKEAMR
jgi:hypothetical protein